MASVVSSVGLGSGLDINGLVTKLVDAEKTPVTTRLDKQETKVQAKLTAYGTFKSALSDFRTSLKGLVSAGSFSQLTTTSSDSSIVTATTAGNADIGSYRVEVKQLAQAHAVASSGYATPSDPVGTGTLTIKFGTYAAGASGSTFTQNADKGALTITVDSSNNTLTGIRDAINKANGGVSAAIVYDGSGYRLVMNSSDGGAKNALNVSGISALQYTGSPSTDRLTETQAAQDAKVAINGLDVTGTSNTITGALKGVTLKLGAAKPGTIVTVGVSQNNETLQKSIESFVSAYNDLASTVNEVARYDSTKTTQSALLGDSAVLGAMSSVRSAITRPVDGLTGKYRSLSDIGIGTNSDGSLKLDSAKLSAALSANRDGVAAVFTMIGQPSDSGVSYVAGTASTQAGTYSVAITHAATKGLLQGQTALTFPVTLNSTNNQVAVTVDGTSTGTLSLSEGSYASATELASELQSRINGSTSLRSAGAAVTVEVDGDGKLVITSKSYGSSSSVSVSTANATLGLASGVGSTDGTDVAGTIGGVEAEGSGRELTSTSGPSIGLKLLLNDDGTGSRGSVIFARGGMERLDNLLNSLLGSRGSITARTEGLNKTLDEITQDRLKLVDRMDALQTRLLKQFTQMDSTVGQLQSMSSYLTQQLAALSGNSSSK